MAILRYLAMTAAEIRKKQDFPGRIGWMACHFSPYSTGLSNLPYSLPPASLLILNDYTPIQGHDPEVAAGQLRACVEALGCRGILLDFQRLGEEQAAAFVRHLVQVLPCPVGVSEGYADGLDCPVFSSPVPPSVPLSEHLAPWQGREIWLEQALDGEIITLAEKGAEVTPQPHAEVLADGFAEERLHCHYRIESAEDAVKFTLWRTREDLEDLLREAEAFGVTTAVGLYQELHNFTEPKASPRTRTNG